MVMSVQSPLSMFRIFTNVDSKAQTSWVLFDGGVGGGGCLDLVLVMENPNRRGGEPVAEPSFAEHRCWMREGGGREGWDSDSLNPAGTTVVAKLLIDFFKKGKKHQGHIAKREKETRKASQQSVATQSQTSITPTNNNKEHTNPSFLSRYVVKGYIDSRFLREESIVHNKTRYRRTIKSFIPNLIKCVGVMTKTIHKESLTE